MSATKEGASKNEPTPPQKQELIIDTSSAISADQIYSARRSFIADFNFGTQTAIVFDDMLVRSVPFYLEVQRMMAELACDFATEGTNVYDLGCSTGTTLALLDQVLPPKVKLVGMDYSNEMLQKAREKIKKHGARHEVEFQLGDLNKSAEVQNASVVIMNLTLQFIRPLYREKIIQQIASGMAKNGAIILIEKVLSQDSLLNRYFIKYYYDFKQRNGYTQMEISQKREALENVLIPYRTQENAELLLKCGFTDCEIFFKWYNFCGYIARKNS